MSNGVVLGGGLGCFTWVGVTALAWAVGMGLLRLLNIHLDDNEGAIAFAVLALSTLILSWNINRNMERKEAEQKAETARNESAAYARRLELDNKYYRENPERLVTDVCPMCNMVIPAFAQICPYCRSNLRKDR